MTGRWAVPDDGPALPRPSVTPPARHWALRAARKGENGVPDAAQGLHGHLTAQPFRYPAGPGLTTLEDLEGGFHGRA